MSKLIDLVGRTFGRLTVIHKTNGQNKNIAYWECDCLCGRKCIVSGLNLKNGHTASCGCLRTEAAARASSRNITHGMFGTRTYNCWVAMKKRCQNPKNRNFSKYGARGISVCERWATFENFLADMGEMPIGMSIERNDVNGNYEPGNCRWATVLEQCNNKRNNHLVSHNGETKTIAEWARHYGVAYGSFCRRIQLGWSVDDAAHRPIRSTTKCAK